MTAQELFERKRKHAEVILFFREMERNIVAKIGNGYFSSLPAAGTDEKTPGRPTLIMPSASSESDIIPFSPTSSHSSESANTNSSTGMAREYTPSLLRAPSSSSEYSNSSSASSSKGALHVRRNTTGTIHLKEIPCSFNIDSTIEVSVYLARLLSETSSHMTLH